MLLDTYSERIRFVRSLMKLSRKGFEEKYGINQNTLKSWELGINTLTEKSAIQVAAAIQQEGLSCSPEWLIFGLGSEPRLINTHELLFNEISEQSKIIYEAEYFKKNNKNSIISMITDTSMTPTYQVGDYVGGISKDSINDYKTLYSFKGKICIISLTNCSLVIRKIVRGNNDIILLCPINEEFTADTVKINDIQSIACIIWHRSTAKI